MDRRVSFIQTVTEQGESNERKITLWELIDDNHTVNAWKWDNAGNTFIDSDRITYNQQTNWTIRYRTDLNVRMRLVYGMQVYEILSITEVNEVRKRYLKVTTQILDNEYFT